MSWRTRCRRGSGPRSSPGRSNEGSGGSPRTDQGRPGVVGAGNHPLPAPLSLSPTRAEAAMEPSLDRPDSIDRGSLPWRHLLLAAGIVVVLLAPTLGYPLGRDQSLFAYVGR